MTKQSIIFFLLIVVGFSLVNGQNEAEESISSLKPFMILVGEWEGEGWMMTPSRERKEFTQKETVAPKINNQLLVVDGIGYPKVGETEKVVHNAFGLITYNPELKAVTMLSYSTTGGKMETPMKMIGEKKLQWSFKSERGGTVRFSLDFTEENTWKEIGHYSPDGKQWFPFIEMTLHRVDK